MLGIVAITPWHWAGFILCVLFFLALDLGFLHRGSREVGFREALRWSIFWCILAMAFTAVLVPMRGREEAVEFITGYIIEMSLSMDNLFIIALIFTYFQVPSRYQHRVLFWGIIGALVMRGVMILVGVDLIIHFQWLLYVCGVFIVYTGAKMLLSGEEKIEPEKNLVIRLARKCFPVSGGDHGDKLAVRVKGRLMLTQLALVLLMVETTDLLFATDSIPAIFGVTTKPFIVFTSNVFAILGLRSLYFLLAGAIDYFRYLKIGLAVVLVFVGVKMLAAPHGSGPRYWFQFEVSTAISLAIIAAILLTAMLISVSAGKRERETSMWKKK